jgi:SPOR domain
MTDDSRFRAPRAHGLPQTQQPAGARVRRTEDPLAELARLIGQEDPFADFVAHRPADGRAGGHAGAQRRAPARDARSPDPRTLERSRRPAAPARSPDAFDDRDGHEDRPRTDGRGAYAYGGSRAPRADDIPAVSTRSLGEERAPAARPSARPAQNRPAAALGAHESEIDLEPKTARDSRTARRASAPQRADDGYDDYAGADYDPEYDDDAYLPAHGDEFYDEAPRARLKGWMLVGVAAAAVVIVGTSGLFAYRALFGVNDVAAPAKIISPTAGPTKVVPGSTSQSADNKRIQDRVGGELPRSAERIVPREENPIDQSRIPQSGSADRIPAGTVTAAPQFSPPPSQAAPLPTVAPANVSTEPRRVRTVTVRADGSVVSNSAGAIAPASAARTGPATPAQASGNPLALQGQAAALPPPRPAATASSSPLQGDNPWSTLSSGQVSGATTQAALPPQPAPVQSAPPPAIAVNTPPPAGSYVVQVAAQKSEGEAQASWQSLQQRYGSVLGAQQATIRRVDLGERGVFYRAQVGPFATRAQASEVCQSLKAAGGECVIQRN